MTTAAVITDHLGRTERWYEQTRPPYSVLVDHTRNMARAFGVYKMLGLDSLHMARPSAFIVNRGLEVVFMRIFEGDTDVPQLEEYRRIVKDVDAESRA